jgi:hypothetical protein
MSDKERQESSEEASSGEKPGYEVVPNGNAVSEEDLYSFRKIEAEADAGPQVIQQVARPSHLNLWVERLCDSATGKRSPFLALGVVIGVPLAIVIAVGAWTLLKPIPPYDDLGAGIFNAAGLKGNLIAKWEGKAEYRLRIEPIYQQQLAGFEATITDPPRPLSVDIRLMDSSNFVLCGKKILLKFDPRNAAIYAGTNLATSASNAVAAPAARDAAAQEADLARQDAEELQREHEQDIFQNEIGSDGQIAAIGAQGDLPCPVESYKRIVSWDMTADFPVIDEQKELQARQAWVAAHPEWSAIRSHGAEKNRIATIKSLPSPIEGDDVITGENPSQGIVGTGAGREFFINRNELLNPAAGWLVFPAAIHYRCEKNGACIITRLGTTAVQHARLKR